MTPKYVGEHFVEADIALNHTEGVPDDEGQFWYLLSFLAQFHQCRFSRRPREQLGDPA